MKNERLYQSAAYILGLFQKKHSVFGPVGGNEEDLRGTKKTKIAPNFGALLLSSWVKDEIFGRNVGSRSV